MYFVHLLYYFLREISGSKIAEGLFSLIYKTFEVFNWPSERLKHSQETKF